jgi:hypothetical protein
MSCPYCSFSRGLGKQHLGDYSRLQSNMFSPKPHGKWQWRHIVRRAFWKCENQTSFLFIIRTVNFCPNILILCLDPVPLLTETHGIFLLMIITEIFQLAGCKGGCRQKQSPCCRCCGGWRSILETKDRSTPLQASIETTFLYSYISGIIY